MVCNGYNHPKDCKCNFRGGHPNSRPPTWRGWRPRALHRYHSGPNATCPECYAHIYYVPGPHGGGAYFDLFGPPWPKHACTNKPKPYSPYGRTGKPKLKNRRSEFEKNGWLPFFIRNIESLAKGTIVHGVAADNPTVRHLATLQLAFSIDRNRPIYFRGKPGMQDMVEFNYFPLGSVIPNSIDMYDDCKNDLELILRSKTP